MAHASHADDSGWTVFRRTPAVAWLFLVVFCFSVFYMPIEVALPLLVKGPLNGTAAGLGIIWTGFGIGVPVGSLCTILLRRRSQTALLVTILGRSGAAGHRRVDLRTVHTCDVQLRAVQARPTPATASAGPLVRRARRCRPIGLILAAPLIELTGSRASIIISGALTIALVPAAPDALRPDFTHLLVLV